MPKMRQLGGRASRDMLRQIFGDWPVSCEDTGERTRGRIVAVCAIAVDGRAVDIGAVLIHAGHPRDCPRY